MSSGRRGGALLAGLATGALLVGGLALAAPGAVPVTLGAESSELPPLTSPRPEPTTVPLAALPPVPTRTPAPVAPTSAAAPVRESAAAPSEEPEAEPAPTPRPPAPRPEVEASGGPTAAVVALTNDARADAGCAPLRVDDRITAAAQAHSEDMSGNGYFSHDSRDGRSFADRISDAGYPSPGAENIAQGQRSAAEVVQAWLDSPGHRRNIEDCSLRTIGVGLAGGDFYWTQDFGR